MKGDRDDPLTVTDLPFAVPDDGPTIYHFLFGDKLIALPPSPPGGVIELEVQQEPFSDGPDGPEPACADECRAEIIDWFKRAAEIGLGEAEVHVTAFPPIFESDYEPLAAVCPHGVTWYAVPTPEQIASWVEDEIE